MTSTAPFLGVAGGAPTIVLIHGGTSTVPKLQAAMPGATAVVVYREGLSSGYSEVSGLAKEYPTLRGLLAKYAPSWQPGTPLVVLGYSAGGWALRHYLRDASARSDINAAVFLDSLYGAPGDKCDLSPYGGVVAFAKLANQEPANHRLIMTYSQAHPAPGICSETIGKSYAGPGVFVRPAGNADHSAQQGVAGPAVVKELVAPWIGGATSSGSAGGLSLVWLAVGVAVAGAVGVALLRPRAFSENPASHVTLYHGTSRRTADLLLSQGLRRTYKTPSDWQTFGDEKIMVGSGVVLFLTDSLGLARNFAAKRAGAEDESRGTVLRVRVPTRSLHPDHYAYGYLNRRLEGREHYAVPKSWKKSLSEIGSVFYRGSLRPEDVTFVETVRAKDPDVVRSRVLDPRKLVRVAYD